MSDFNPETVTVVDEQEARIRLRALAHAMSLLTALKAITAAVNLSDGSVKGSRVHEHAFNLVELVEGRREA